MKLIAISGWVKSGKDTAANMLISDYGFKRVAFADPLKETVAEQFDISLPSLHTQEGKEKPILSMPVDPRDAYSKMIAEFLVKEFRTQDGRQCDHGIYFGGTRFMGIGDDNNFVQLYWTGRALCILEGSSKRSVIPNYWVRQAIIEAKQKGYDKVVISDLRYKNELSSLREYLDPGDHMVSVRVNRFDTSPSNDPSERDLDDGKFDFVIENRSTMANFLKEVSKVAEHTLSLK